MQNPGGGPATYSILKELEEQGLLRGCLLTLIFGILQNAANPRNGHLSIPLGPLEIVRAKCGWWPCNLFNFQRT